MANHVSTWIEVTSDNNEVYQKMIDMFRGASWEDQQQTMWWYKKLYNLDESVEYDRGEYTEDMGAKWCYIDDSQIEDEYCEINTTSAWSWPKEAIEQLWNVLSEVDEDVEVSFTFEDEGLNFIGGGCMWRGEMVDYSEDWSDKIPNEEDEDYDEKWESLWDNVADAKDELMVEARTDVYLENGDDDEEE